MIHLGDITNLRGDAIPPVDCITGGSPCQDLSVAGKRAGLAGERSGLFMEQIRIVKEMRERDRRNGRSGWLVRPRFMVWENVPGAFSSNKGRDFQAVLSEIVKVVEADAPDVPLPDKGKWTKAGCLYDDMGRWSVAWRLHDAQFWGVPQRRKRIALVADFGGLAAPEILFERNGLRWDSAESGAQGEGTAAGAEGGAGGTVAWTYRGRESGCNVEMQDELAYALRNPNGGGSQPNILQRRYVPMVANTLSARYDGSPQPDKGNGANIVAVHQNASGEVRENDVAYTISTNSNASGRNTPLVYDSREPLCIEMKSSNPHSGVYETETSRTLDLNGGSPACNQGGWRS